MGVGIRRSASDGLRRRAAAHPALGGIDAHSRGTKSVRVSPSQSVLAEPDDLASAQRAEDWRAGVDSSRACPSRCRARPKQKEITP
jgi:hypothetical protein